MELVIEEEENCNPVIIGVDPAKETDRCVHVVFDRSKGTFTVFETENITDDWFEELGKKLLSICKEYPIPEIKIKNGQKGVFSIMKNYYELERKEK